MFGFSHIPAASTLLPTRPTTLTALAVAAAAAFCFALAGPAHAGDCNGGYRMLKGEIPIACERGAQALFSGAQSTVSEPLTTGSINRSPLPAGGAEPSLAPAAASSNSEANCVGGMRSIITANNGMSLMLKCS